MGDKGKKKRIHWKQWEELCCFKLDGGLGFKDLESFNLAMLAKQWWRLIQNDSSLSYKVSKARYFPRLNPNKASKCPNASYLWKSLLEGRKMIKESSIWRVGDGKQIDVWKNKWLKKSPSFKVQLPDHVEPIPMKVEKLLLEGKKEWNMDMVHEMLT